jgi:hypothetical protein
MFLLFPCVQMLNVLLFEFIISVLLSARIYEFPHLLLFSLQREQLLSGDFAFCMKMLQVMIDHLYPPCSEKNTNHTFTGIPAD